MVDDRTSPSAGWREVAHEMAVDTDVEEPTRACPDCGRGCDNVLRDVYECEEHGVFRASAGGGESSPPPADAGGRDADAEERVDGERDTDAGKRADGERDASDEATDRATGRAD